MLNIASATKTGVLVEIVQEGHRCRGDYVVYADGQAIEHKRTIIKAKRAANAIVGETVFDLKEAYVHV